MKTFPIPERWCVHGYYTLCPYAPDGSGRFLAAGADLETNRTEVFVLSAEGKVLDQFGKVAVTPSFWHTGLWQSWSPDARHVYYQAGTLQNPVTVRRELAAGVEVKVKGDLEGCPPLGEPGVSSPHGLLYAAGYGDGKWKPEEAPVPFLERKRHGISLLTFDPPQETLALSTQDLLDRHPLREKILEAEQELKDRLGPEEGLTLMTYCVRWSPDGKRFLFYFGNHCVVPERGEPRIATVFTSDREMKEIHMAIDLSFERRGVHWGWQPDNERLIGYGPDPENPERQGLIEVRYDGTRARWISPHNSGGHPSVSPANPDLVVTDEGSPTGGNVVFISKRTGDILQKVPLPKFIGDKEVKGGNPLRICHHPVFSPDGKRILVNTLPGHHAQLAELDVETLLRRSQL
ncbi:MAG: PD40 domain-containing protein [Verrucomicrobia bacterium]|nr:PD40 domain-containing protein [Verrucomicrobiota bacterium]MCH8526646.1 hypothetical protein [Kiritimatiellia bacterium]